MRRGEVFDEVEVRGSDAVGKIGRYKIGCNEVKRYKVGWSMVFGWNDKMVAATRCVLENYFCNKALKSQIYARSGW